MMRSNQDTATMATIIKDSFTHRIQSAHVDGMEYLINVHLPPTYGMSEDSYPVIYYTDAFFGTEIVTGPRHDGSRSLGDRPGKEYGPVT